MAQQHHLIYAIIKYLNAEKDSGKLSEDAAESLEVAAQCLETAYEVNSHDAVTASRYPLPASLEDLFKAGLKFYGVSGPVDVSAVMKDKAEKLKADGNELMKQEKFSEAITCYTSAIDIDGTNAVYYCNRAAAHSKLDQNNEALADCEKAIRIDPYYSKAYARKGLAHSALNQNQEAIGCYKKALELDPENPSHKQNLEIAEKKLENGGPGVAIPGMPGMPGAGGPGGPAGLNLGGLDFSSMMSNPALMNMATNMMQNPQIQNMMANLMSGQAGDQGGSPGMTNLLQAGQQLAAQMQATNPELVEQLRSQMGPENPDDNPPQNHEGN